MVASVFVVDDDPALQAVVMEVVQSVGYRAQAFSSAGEFLSAYTAGSRGCIILDVRMPGMSGLELQAELRARGIDLPVIMITGFADVAVVTRALKGGAFDFIEKPFSNQHLLETVAKALAVDQERQSLLTACAEFERRLATLTAREREILQAVVAGKSNKVIAADNGLSQRTVEVHRERIMEKLRVAGVADLVRTVTAVRLARAEDGARKGAATAYATAVREELGPSLSEHRADAPDGDPRDR
jgi:FixJ family two-component response regulator